MVHDARRWSLGIRRMTGGTSVCTAWAGRASPVFPQAIGLAATWNADLMHRVATVISDRRGPSTTAPCARGEYWYNRAHLLEPEHQYLSRPPLGRAGNLWRGPHSPRGWAWPLYGLGGRRPRYLKLVATAKHYAVHRPRGRPPPFRRPGQRPRPARPTCPPLRPRCEAKVHSVMGAITAPPAGSLRQQDLVAGHPAGRVGALTGTWSRLRGHPVSGPTTSWWRRRKASALAVRTVAS